MGLPLFKTHGSKPQSICYYGHGTETHRGGGNDRAQENPEERKEGARSDWHAKQIVYEGEEKILANVPHYNATELHRFDDPAEIATAMNCLVENPSLTAELVARGRERAAYYSWDRCIGETVSLYQRLLTPELAVC